VARGPRRGEKERRTEIGEEEEGGGGWEIAEIVSMWTGIPVCKANREEERSKTQPERARRREKKTGCEWRRDSKRE